MGSINIPIIESQGEKSDREYMLYLANMLAIMRDQLVNVMEGRLSTNNIRELIADKIKTGTLDAGLVTIRADYPGGAYIVLDSNGMVINDGTENVFEADTSGNLLLRGIIYALGGLIGGWTIGADKLSGSGVIEGGTIRTAASGDRVEIEDGLIKIYQSDGTLRMVIDSTLSPPKINFYDSSGNLSASIYHSGGNLLISGEDGTAITDNTALSISSPSLVIASPNLTGSPKINGGTTLGTRSQSDSTAATVADLVDDFNDLLDDLRAMKILSS